MSKEEPTPEEVRFDTTSSPWINLGIVSLFKFLERHKDDFGSLEGNLEELYQIQNAIKTPTIRLKIRRNNPAKAGLEEDMNFEEFV